MGERGVVCSSGLMSPLMVMAGMPFLWARRRARLEVPGGDSPINIIGCSMSKSELVLESSESYWGDRFSSDREPIRNMGPVVVASEMDMWRRMSRLTATAFSANASSSFTLWVLKQY